MKSMKLPIKLAVIILGIFQIYSISKNLNEDTITTIISIFILLGCIIILAIDLLFNKKS